MSILGLALGLVVVYFCSGRAALQCFVGKCRYAWLMAPAFSIILLGTTYGIWGLITPVAVTPVRTVLLTALFSGSFLAIYYLRAKRPLLQITPPEMELSPAYTRAGYWLYGVFITLVVLSHATGFINRFPNISDSLMRTSIVSMIAQTGIPPCHWVQPSIPITCYFYTYVPTAAFMQFAPSLSSPAAWSIHAIVQTQACAIVIILVLRHVARSSQIYIVALTSLLLGSSFSLIPGLLTHSPALNGWINTISGLVPEICCETLYVFTIWCPPVQISITLVMLLVFIRWRTVAPIPIKIAITSLSMGFMVGGCTFIFLVLSLGIGTWCLLCLIRRDWTELKFWTLSGLFAVPLVWPYYQYISGCDGLTLAQNALPITSHGWINRAAGIGLIVVYVFFQLGIPALLGVILMVRLGKKQISASPETFFCLAGIAGALICLIFLAPVSNITRGELNNLFLRGMPVVSVLLVLAVAGMSWMPLFERPAWKRYLLWGLLLYCTTPALYSFLGTMNFARQMKCVPTVTHWANQHLPPDAVVTVDEAVLHEKTDRKQQDYLRARWSWIERQKWIPAKEMVYWEVVYAKASSMGKLLKQPVPDPLTTFAPRPVYLFRHSATPPAPGVETVYKDQDFAIDLLSANK